MDESLNHIHQDTKSAQLIAVSKRSFAPVNLFQKFKLRYSLRRILKNTDHEPALLTVFCDLATIKNLNSSLWSCIFKIILTARHSIG